MLLALVLGQTCFWISLHSKCLKRFSPHWSNRVNPHGCATLDLDIEGNFYPISVFFPNIETTTKLWRARALALALRSSIRPCFATFQYQFGRQIIAVVLENRKILLMAQTQQILVREENFKIATEKTIGFNEQSLIDIFKLIFVRNFWAELTRASNSCNKRETILHK